MNAMMLTAASGGILGDVGTGLTQVLSWIGQVVTALVGADGALGPLWPLIGISIGISVVLFSIKVLKGFTWGM